MIDKVAKQQKQSSEKTISVYKGTLKYTRKNVLFNNNLMFFNWFLFQIYKNSKRIDDY